MHVLLMAVAILGNSQRLRPKLSPPLHPWDGQRWNKFQCHVGENLLRQTADRHGQSGMKDAGYQYVHHERLLAKGLARKKKGTSLPMRTLSLCIKALGRLHSRKGLKFGIYSDAGAKTCAASRQPRS